MDAAKGVQIQNRELGLRVSPSTLRGEDGGNGRSSKANKYKQRDRDCGNSKWKSENESEGFEWLSG